MAQEGRITDMRVNRKLIYAGVFLVAVGGVLVAADVGGVEAAALADALRLWPIAIVAVGLALALRRTRLSLSSGLLAAAVPGLLLGGAFAVAPRVTDACGAGETPTATVLDQGTFEGPASVVVITGCGSLTVGTAPGNAWQVAAGNSAGRAPHINASPESLAVDIARNDEWGFLDGGRDNWQLILPTARIDELSFTANASHSTIALPGAQIGSLQLRGNAAQVDADLTSAVIEDLSARIDLGDMTIHLPATGEYPGTIRADLARVVVCSPPGVGLRLTFHGNASEIRVGGLQVHGSSWESPDYETATNHADLDARIDFGLIEINPIGGC